VLRSAASAALAALLLASLAACDKPADKAAPVASAAPSAPAAPPSAPAAPPVEPKKPAEPPTSVTAQHVLVAYKGAERCPKGVTRSKADAKKRAAEVAEKAKGGADFTALVAEYSDDPAAKERLGSVGKFTRDKMAKPFSDAAFSLSVNEVSAPVETPFGFHVIKRNQ
jgi:peptidyl-prolyl cis-trans isomerase NIMA-interacting 1